MEGGARVRTGLHEVLGSFTYPREQQVERRNRDGHPRSGRQAGNPGSGLSVSQSARCSRVWDVPPHKRPHTIWASDKPTPPSSRTLAADADGDGRLAGRGGGRLGLPHAAPEKQTCRGRAPDQGVRWPRAEDDRLFRRGQKKQTRKKEKDVSAHNIARAPFPPFALSQSASAARVAAMTAGWLRARNHAASQRAGQRANQPASFAANQPTQPGRPQARRGEAAIISAGRGVTPVRRGVESVMLRPEAGAELGKAWKKWGGGYSTRWQP